MKSGSDETCSYCGATRTEHDPVSMTCARTGCPAFRSGFPTGNLAASETYHGFSETWTPVPPAPPDLSADVSAGYRPWEIVILILLCAVLASLLWVFAHTN